MTNKTDKNKVLKERAKILQKTAVNLEENGEQSDFLQFLLSEEKYAIDSTYVSEVIRISDLTPLPCTPSFILGIVNKRGQILSVIDIKKFFNLPEKGITNLNRVIIVKYSEIEIGILTDEIIGNIAINTQTLQSELPAINKIANNYIMGITKERLIVLDIKEVLRDEKIIINEEI